MCRHGLEGARYGRRLRRGHLHLWCREPGFFVCLRRCVTRSPPFSCRILTLFPGPKTSVHTHLNYLVIISPPVTANAASASATIRNFAARNVGASGTEVTKITVFDLENKFVAHSEPFTEGVREVFSQWGNIYVLSNDGKLSCLQEKPTATKLDMLYRRGYYVLALDVAKTQQMGKESVADIHRKYGDYLYAKPDYDAAMQQYLQTIGYVQPSYVIRKVGRASDSPCIIKS